MTADESFEDPCCSFPPEETEPPLLLPIRIHTRKHYLQTEANKAEECVGAVQTPRPAPIRHSSRGSPQCNPRNASPHELRNKECGRQVGVTPLWPCPPALPRSSQRDPSLREARPAPRPGHSHIDRLHTFPPPAPRQFDAVTIIRCIVT